MSVARIIKQYGEEVSIWQAPDKLMDGVFEGGHGLLASNEENRYEKRNEAKILVLSLVHHEEISGSYQAAITAYRRADWLYGKNVNGLLYHING